MINKISNNDEEFTQEINNMVRHHHLSVVDAIVLFCEEHTMDIHDVVPLIDNTMKEKLRISWIENRMIKESLKSKSLF